jgi:hypothetical protein
MPLPLDMPRQPTDTSCGPTCLHAVYAYHGVRMNLADLVAQIPQFEEGGTLSVHLAIHALRHGFHTRLVPYNVGIFDPTWWDFSPREMTRRLLRRIPHLRTPKDIASHHAYVEYLQLGGRLEFFDLGPKTLAKLLAEGGPIITGLSATYLYREKRQMPDGRPDDIGGAPAGHFLVVTGCDEEKQQVFVEDPLAQNPFNPLGEYNVDVHRFINAVLLGIATYDANLLVVTPPGPAAVAAS